MTQDLCRLVYYSRNRIARDPGVLAAEIAAIVEVSRRNNTKASVTGALMFNAGCFGQVLEGPRAAVEGIFERIQQDDRHGEVSLLGITSTDRRHFESWSMGFVGGSVEDAARFGQVATDSGYDPSKMTGDALFVALQTLALEQEAA